MLKVLGLIIISDSKLYLARQSLPFISVKCVKNSQKNST